MLLQASYLEKCFCCINSPNLTMHTVLYIRPPCLTSPIPCTSYLAFACTQHPFWLASSFFPLKSVSSFSNESDFFLQAWDINRLSNGPTVAIHLAFHPNLMPSTVEAPRTDEIPTSGPNKITKACKTPHHVKA